MHQFILNNIEFILAIIIVAQGVILYGQSTIYKWCKIHLLFALDAIQKLAKFDVETVKAIDDVYNKINLGK